MSVKIGCYSGMDTLDGSYNESWKGFAMYTFFYYLFVCRSCWSKCKDWCTLNFQAVMISLRPDYGPAWMPGLLPWASVTALTWQMTPLLQSPSSYLTCQSSACRPTMSLTQPWHISLPNRYSTIYTLNSHSHKKVPVTLYQAINNGKQRKEFTLIYLFFLMHINPCRATPHTRYVCTLVGRSLIMA